MSNICSDMAHILDRMVSIMELHTPLKAKLDPSIDGETQITVDALVADEFMFPINANEWVSVVMATCREYKPPDDLKVQYTIKQDAQKTIKLDAKYGRFIMFAPGKNEERSGQFYPSYAMYRLGSTDSYYYRRINKTADVTLIIGDFLKNLIPNF
jgi:hypothetical protein